VKTNRLMTLAVGSAAAIAGIAGPATTALAADAPATPNVVAQSAEKSLGVDFQLQETGYYCAPAATRVALTAQQHTMPQDQVATKLGTTHDGTASITQVTDTLNHELGDNPDSAYTTVELPNPDTDEAATAKFKADVVNAIDHGKVVVANIVGTATDTDGDEHTYAGGHYIPIVGYTNNGDTVQIADSAGKADSSGDKTPNYQVNTTTMADWMATRGYTA
jgi:hypothetical protein